MEDQEFYLAAIHDLSMRFGRWPRLHEPLAITDETKIETESETEIGQFCFIHASRLVMCRGAQIKPSSILTGGGEIMLGPYSNVGYGAKLITTTDTPRGEWMSDAKPESERAVVRGSITLEEGAFIGTGAVVCVSRHTPHIVIHRHAVVGANAYLDQSLDAETVYTPGKGGVYTPRQNYRC